MSVRRDQVDLLRGALQYSSDFMAYADMKDLVTKGYADAVASSLARRNYQIPPVQVTGSNTRFILPFPLQTETAEVYVDGLLQPQANYTWITNNLLQFNTAPNSTQTIELYYQQYVNLGDLTQPLSKRSVVLVEEDTTLELQSARDTLVISKTDVSANLVTLPQVSGLDYRGITVVILSLGLNPTTIKAQGGGIAGETELVLNNRSAVKLQSSDTTSDWFKLTGDRASATT